MLGSGNHKNYYEQLVAYDHGFVMPELPNEDEQDAILSESADESTLFLEGGRNR
jgi:hypothetical protein